MLYLISRLTKVYGSRTVLDIESLEIMEKKIYALLGPNGSGKTTFLKILGFLDLPTSGNVQYCTRPVRFLESQLQPLRKEVVMVNQHPILFTTTVYRNLEFGLRIRKISKKKCAYIIDEALDMVGMRHFSQAPAHRLSGGETQRVALARALALSPQVILCDEPTSSVDPENQGAIINLLRQINDEKQISLIFTTHNQSQASMLAHHTLFLDHGKLGTTSYDNLFAAVASRKDENSSLCKIQNTVELVVPGDRDGEIRLMIDPEKIDILETRKKDHGENCFRGNIVQITKEGGKIRIGVDSEIYFIIRMPADDYTRRKPMVGDNMAFRIPRESIKLLS